MSNYLPQNGEDKTLTKEIKQCKVTFFFFFFSFFCLIQLFLQMKLYKHGSK
jgi:hypothetical protein